MGNPIECFEEEVGIEGGEVPCDRASVARHQGDPAQGLTERLERGNIQVLVLAAARDGGPGVLVNHFTALAGTLPCLLVIVPAGLDEQALGKLAE